jgi:hypothetical protein
MVRERRGVTDRESSRPRLISPLRLAAGPGGGSKPRYCRTVREDAPQITPESVSDAYAELASDLVRSSAEQTRGQLTHSGVAGQPAAPPPRPLPELRYGPRIGGVSLILISVGVVNVGETLPGRAGWSALGRCPLGLYHRSRCLSGPPTDTVQSGVGSAEVRALVLKFW